MSELGNPPTRGGDTSPSQRTNVVLATVAALSSIQLVAQRLQDGAVRRVLGAVVVLADLFWSELLLGALLVLLLRLVRSRSVQVESWSLDDMTAALKEARAAKGLALVAAFGLLSMLISVPALIKAKGRMVQDLGGYVTRGAVQHFTSGDLSLSVVYLQACVDLHLPGGAACSTVLADIERRLVLIARHRELLGRLSPESGARWRVLDSIFSLDLNLEGWKDERERLDGEVDKLRQEFSHAIKLLAENREAGLKGLAELNAKAPGFGDAHILLGEARAMGSTSTPQLDALKRLGPQVFAEQKLRRYRPPSRPENYWLTVDLLLDR